jgi:hypothetical protein
MTRVTQNADDWQAGYNAGMSGGSSMPPEVTDRLAYASGFIEGKAARIRATTALALDDYLTRNSTGNSGQWTPHRS